MKLFATILVMSFLLGYVPPSEIGNMSITFDGVNDYLTYPSVPAAEGLTTMTYMGWIYPTTWGNQYSAGFFEGEIFSQFGAIVYNDLSVADSAANHRNLKFVARWSSGGVWNTNADPFALSTRTHIAVTYNANSTANVPIIYINGASVTVNVVAAAGGSLVSDSGQPIYMGNINSGATAAWYTGRIDNFLVYNRILSASEVQDAYNSRLTIPTYNGLVFSPLLYGASGLQTYDGTTLTTSNKIIDAISGTLGTPTNSPVGNAESYLRIR